jgi:uncharacterized protein (TIGR03437 family)
MTIGSQGRCRVTLDGVTGSSVSEVRLSSSTNAVQVPATVITRPGRWSAEFQVDVIDSVADAPVAISAQLGSATISERLSIQSGRPSLLAVPSHLFARFDEEVHLAVSGPDVGGTLSVGSLPDGASFDPTTGIFDWTPRVDQQGPYNLAFTETGSQGDVTTKTVHLEVDAGEPAIKRIVNSASRSEIAACSPGATATLEGKWLTDGSASSDPSGNSSLLSGATVRANGNTLAVLYASPTRVDFQCPALAPGTKLALAVETDRGVTLPVETILNPLAPGIFSIDGSGSAQGSVNHAEQSTLAMLPNYRYFSQPAQPGDLLEILATGIDGAIGVLVNIGGVQVTPTSISSVPGRAGVSRVSFVVPPSVGSSDSANLSLTGLITGGTTATSNTVSLAIER